MTKITEDELEQFAIELFKELGYEYDFGPDIAPDSKTPLREDYKDVLLTQKLKDALKK